MWRSWPERWVQERLTQRRRRELVESRLAARRARERVVVDKYAPRPRRRAVSGEVIEDLSGLAATAWRTRSR